MKQKNELFRINIRNLGPIEEGEIELKPLTILFGKNNTGKTYAGYLLWGLAFQRKFPDSLKIKTENYSKIIREIKEKLQNRKISRSYENFPIQVDYFLGKYTLNKLEAEIRKGFVKKLFNYNIKFEWGEIVIPKKVNFSIGVIVKDLAEFYEYESFLLSQLRGTEVPILFIIREFEVDKNEYDYDKESTDSKGTEEPREENKEREVRMNIAKSIILTKDKKGTYHFILILTPKAFKNFESECGKVFEDMLIELIRSVISDTLKNAVYIPASKSGLILLSGFIARKSIEDQFRMVEHTWIEERETLPEPIIDFINRTPNLSPELYSEQENKQFSDIVNFVERNIISGEITYNKRLGKITYKFEGREGLPLQQASSLVVESSPLLLYLKYSNFVKRGTLIIIEEPEAHLHPDAQRVIARTLVRLVNRGLYIVLITHSPYIIQQINNCIRAHYLNKVGKLGNFLDEFKWQEDDILEPSKVASYLFDGSSGKVKVKKLEVDEKEGIPYDAFYPVLKDLHNETEKLRELLEGDETNDKLGGD